MTLFLYGLAWAFLWTCFGAFMHRSHLQSKIEEAKRIVDMACENRDRSERLIARMKRTFERHRLIVAKACLRDIAAEPEIRDSTARTATLIAAFAVVDELARRRNVEGARYRVCSTCSYHLMVDDAEDATSDCPRCETPSGMNWNTSEQALDDVLEHVCARSPRARGWYGNTMEKRP